MSLPKEAVARKAVPLYSGFIKYFPDAIAAVAELSRIGNEQHNPGKPLHWDRSKSGDELDALARHLAEAGTFDTDGVRHSTKIAWRALANLQKEIEEGRLDGGEPSRRPGEMVEIPARMTPEQYKFLYPKRAQNLETELPQEWDGSWAEREVSRPLDK